MSIKKPILWTFRRCPYAMRARMAVEASGVKVEYREILLRDKPAAMLALSPKGTVPVCVFQEDSKAQAPTVIEESLDIMFWALNQNDPEDWLGKNDRETVAIKKWTDANDAFKPFLDRYKYPDRYENSEHEEVLEQCRAHLEKLDQAIAKESKLVGDRTTLADVALMPFVRQFHLVDKTKLSNWGTQALLGWLDTFLESERFASVMKKRSLWVARGRA